ncbi:TonB-dependent receptor [Gluconobacter oxydans]|uniref:TonB-dependent receptor n=1 Tax=Gluconobacter oxydans TaxID=442 RepID=UPI0039E7B0FB
MMSKNNIPLPDQDACCFPVSGSRSQPDLKRKGASSFLVWVLASTAFSCCAAQAADPKKQTRPVVHHNAGKAAPVVPVRSKAARARRATAREALESESMQVTAHHVPHGAVTTVSSEALADAVPGTNPLKVLARQPGVMFQSDDPQGMDTWSTQFYMHGFLQNQIGMTLDGIPLGDQEFHTFNGLNSVNAISAENVGRMDVSMGAGAESVASTSNLGGAVEYVSSDPKHKAGGLASQTFGSNSGFHTFLRMDSGDLNKSGTRFYVSYMRNSQDKWKGGGDQFGQQVNAKFVQPIGERSSISSFFDYNLTQSYLYQDMSFDMLKNGGYGIDNFYGTPNAYKKAYLSALSANGLPGGALPAGYSKMSDPWDASYYDGALVERDYLGGLKANLALTDRLRWESVVYGHGQYLRGTWANPYVSSPNGAPLIDQATVTHSQRFGFTSALHYQIAHNDISGGVWYENFHTDVGRFGYQEPLLSDVESGKAKPVNSVGELPDPYATLWGQNLNSNSFTAFVQDTYHVLPNLSLHFGFKSLLQTVRGGQYANDESYTGVGQIAGGSITTAKAFLPHISGDWHFLKHHELYFDIAENVKSYPVQAFKEGASPFSVSQSAYNQLLQNGGLKPETDWNFAVGYRFTHKYALASVHAYRTNFHNRLQQVTSGSIVNPVSTVANVGGVTMNGVDAGLTLMPVKGLSLYNSISYNHATYDNNVTEAGTTYHIKGQQIVAYPRFMYKASLAYEWRNFSAHLDTQFLGTRNYSYTGDMKIPSYWIETLGARYRFGNLGKYSRSLDFVQNLTFEFNVYNLTNTKYISTMGETGVPMSGDYQSFLVGAPRQYYGTLKAEF